MAKYIVDGSIETIKDVNSLKEKIYKFKADVINTLQNGTNKEILKAKSEYIHDWANDTLVYTMDTKLKENDKKSYKFYIRCFNLLHGMGEDLMDEYYYKED